MRRTILSRPQVQRVAAKSTQVEIKEVVSVEEPFAKLLARIYKGLSVASALTILTSPVVQEVKTVMNKNILVQDICKGYVGIGCNESLIADISLVVSNNDLASKLSVRDIDRQLLAGKMTAKTLLTLVDEAAAIGTEPSTSLADYLSKAAKYLSNQESLLEVIAVAKTFADFKMKLRQYLDAEALHKFIMASGLDSGGEVEADKPCRVCGCKKVIRNFVQTRSADEPTTIIEFCAKCPRS